jgi:signal transduction histidine kinase/PAS domain-containing protein
LLGGILFAAIGVAGWRFISLTGQLLIREEETHRSLFERSPVALLEEDFTSVAERLVRLRELGVTDVEEYFGDHPDELRELIATIRIRRANQSALAMIGADSLEDLKASFNEVTREPHELDSYVAQFLAIWERRAETAVDLEGVTLDGDSIEAVLHWSAPVQGDDHDLSRVIVAISDITPRKIVEQQLATALDENRTLLDFEHALALCSRSLLMGRGETALEEALTTLRVAIGADRSYLTVNVDDPEQGASFHIVRSVSTPHYAVDEWMGRVIPWSKYPMARDVLVAGESFQYIGTDEPDSGWSRSVLSVPVFTEGRWAGTVGFMDMRRRRPWSNEAVRMLEVAAPMLGTFWEREVTRQRLEELVISKDRFVASVSHELRTPLSAVLGFAQELKANADSYRAEELADMLELIADQSQEMADMVEDLLVSARADIGMVTIHPQDVYLRSQAETVLAGLGSTGGKQIEVVGGRGKVWADPSRTRQIIRNLLTNALRYGGDQVVVEAVERSEETMLTVTDDGPGLDPTRWEEIFEPYQRAHHSPTQPASIGLGLTVARQLARLMGGELTYRTSEEGSVFTLTLPSKDNADEKTEESVVATSRSN